MIIDSRRNELISAWKAEEEIAHIHGWDFSHIDGRYSEQDDLPWDYRAVIGQYLRPEMKIMDIDTGGGEFLLGSLRSTRLYNSTAYHTKVYALRKGLLTEKPFHS